MTSLLLLTTALLGQAQPATPARVASLSGDIEFIPAVASKTLGNTRRVWVYKPRAYKTDRNRRFPVMYLHDGQNVFDGATSFLPNREWRADETAEMLVEAGLMEPIIIVGIANAEVKRADEYLPVSITRGGSKMGGQADPYLVFVADELKPYIDRTYRTKPGPSTTGLGGSSFGGIITLHAGVTRSKTFGKLMVMSPSLWVGEGHMQKVYEALRPRPDVKMWLDTGGNEGPDTPSQFWAFEQTLRKNGWRPGRDFRATIEPRGEHSEDAWARRLPSAFQYLFPVR